MPVTMEQLKRLVEECDFRYFVDPNRPTLLFGARGFNGQYQYILKLELEGRFIQLRTLGYHFAPSTNPHLPKVLEVIGHLNYQMRFVKFGWDPSDGEIVANGDVWVEDASVTTQQLGTMMGNFLSVIDLSSARLKKVIETGTDPGDEHVEAPPGGLPEPVREALDALLGKKKPKKGEDDFSEI